MKKRGIFFLGLIITLLSCQNVNSSIGDSINNSSLESVITLSSQDSSSENEYKEFIKSETNKRLLLTAKNKTNTAMSGWQVSYDANGVNFYIEVLDDDLYTGNIYNTGYDDNVEFLINVKNDSSGWLVNGTYHFLISAAGKTLFERANSVSGLGVSYSSELGVVLGENLNYKVTQVWEENGFNGYIAEVFLSYDVLNTTYEEAFGNLTFCPGMRNAHTYQVDSTWVAYDKRSCKWGNASTFVQINEDGTFGEKLNRDLDCLYIGDTILSLSSWQTFNLDHDGKKVLNIAEKEVTISYYEEEIYNYSECTSKDIIVYLGYNDIKNDTVDITQRVINFASILHTLFDSSNIYFISVIALTEEDDFEAIENLNNEVEKISLEQNYLHYIDIETKLCDEGMIRNGLVYSNHTLNYLGYNILFDKINSLLQIKQNNLPKVFGSNDLYSSSSGYVYRDNYVEGVGDKDQYLIFAKESSIDITASISINACKTFNNDSYPKFGLVLLGKEDTLFFYIDGSSSLSTKKVGYVKGKKHTSWAWTSSVEKECEIAYSGETFQNMSIVKEGNHISMLVDNEEILNVDKFFLDDEKVTAGILSFNTNIKIKDYICE